jgi:hypothetical protein
MRGGREVGRVEDFGGAQGEVGARERGTRREGEM